MTRTLGGYIPRTAQGASSQQTLGGYVTTAGFTGIVIVPTGIASAEAFGATAIEAQSGVQITGVWSRPEFSLVIAGPLPDGAALPMIDLSPDVALSFTSELPGGWASAQIGILDEARRRGLSYAELMRTYLPEHVALRPFGHIEIRVGSATVWEGRAVGDELIGGDIRGIEADGYGISALRDDAFQGGNDIDEISSGRIVRAVMGQHSGLINIGEFEDPGTLHTLSEFARMTPYEVLEALSEEGGGESDNRWIWHVYNRTLSFIERAAPTIADYRPPIDDTVNIRREYRDIWSHARISYQTPSGESALTQEFKDNGTENNFIERHKILEGGTDSNAGAVQFARSFLKKSSTPQYSIQIRRSLDRGLETIAGGHRPAYLVRSGEWVEIEGLGVLPIEQTEFDAQSGEATFNLGQPVRRSWDGIMRRVMETEQALRTGRDAITKTRRNR